MIIMGNIHYHLLSSSLIAIVAVSGEPRVTRHSQMVSTDTSIAIAKVSSPSKTLSGSVGTGTTEVLLPLNIAVKRPPV